MIIFLKLIEDCTTLFFKLSICFFLNSYALSFEFLKTEFQGKLLSLKLYVTISDIQIFVLAQLEKYVEYLIKFILDLIVILAKYVC